MSHHLTADPTGPGDDVMTDHGARPGTPPGPRTPDLRFDLDTPASSAVRLVLRRPVLLLPYALALLASAVLSAAVEMVRAWTGPAMLVDGSFVFAELPSTTAVITAGVLGIVAFAVSATAAGVVVLSAGAVLLGVRGNLAATLREVRRRWLLALGHTVLWGLAVAVVVLVAFAGMVFLGTIVGGLLAAVLGLLVLEVVVRATAPCVAALLDGTRVRHARRELAAGRRYGEAAEHRRRAERTVIGAVVTVVAVLWGVRWATGGVPAPWRDVLVEGVQTAAGSALLTFAAVTLTWCHVRAAGLVELRGLPARHWDGVARVAAGPAAVAHEPGGARRPGRARRLAVAVTVAAAWVATPAVTAAPAALDLTPALSPRTMEVGGPLHGVLLTGTPDGVAIVSRYGERGDTLTRCSLDDGRCVVDIIRGVVPVAAVPDPEEPGLMVLETVWGETAEERGFGLVACSPEDCARSARRSTRARVVTSAAWSSSRYDLAVGGDVLAVAHPTGAYHDEGRGLLVCRASQCDGPTTLPLAFTSGVEPAVAITSDGVAWVVHATATEIRLSRAQVGSTALTDVQSVPARPAGEGDELPAFELGVLDLALLDDGSPVVLYRESTGGPLKVLTCDDAACSGTTDVTVPGGAAADAALAVDGSGLPLVATVGDAGVVLHACRDRECTSVRSGLMATRWPPYGLFGEAVPFFAVDGKDRPAVLVEEQWDEALLVQCPEPRCGL